MKPCASYPLAASTEKLILMTPIDIPLYLHSFEIIHLIVLKANLSVTDDYSPLKNLAWSKYLSIISFLFMQFIFASFLHSLIPCLSIPSLLQVNLHFLFCCVSSCFRCYNGSLHFMALFYIDIRATQAVHRKWN